MTVDRYLLKELAAPFFGGWALLSLIFAAYASAGVLADATLGGLSSVALWRLILLRCVIAAEVIVPTALFFAVLFTFERLNRDRELVALLAGGFSRLRLLVPVVLLAVMVLGLVAALALGARPWAYRTTYLLEDLSARPSVESMQAGNFYRLGDDLVVTAADVSNKTGRLEDVFARQDGDGRLRLIRAQQAHISTVDATGGQVVEFIDGQSLTVITDGASGDRRHRFDRLRYRWQQDRLDERLLNRRAQPTSVLATSVLPKDIAEVQWRLTLPVLTFGMTLMAGALGMLGAGTVTALRLVGAIVSYVAVFNVAAAARSALENGVLAPLPGIWWLPLLPLAMMALVLIVARRRS